MKLNNYDNFLNSFKTRKFHYSLKNSKKLYLLETLNINKLYFIFENKNTLATKFEIDNFVKCLKQFNIKDTCCLGESCF